MGAPGPDGFTAITIKKKMVPVVQHMVAQTFSTGSFPNQLKLKSTIMVHKKGDTENLKNYHSISLLSVFDKILEKTDS